MKVCVCVHARESVCMCVRLCVHTSINEHQIYTQGTHTHLCSHGGMYAQVEHVSSHFEYTHVSGHTDNRTIWWNAHRWYAPSPSTHAHVWGPDSGRTETCRVMQTKVIYTVPFNARTCPSALESFSHANKGGIHRPLQCTHMSERTGIVQSCKQRWYTPFPSLHSHVWAHRHAYSHAHRWSTLPPQCTHMFGRAGSITRSTQSTAMGDNKEEY
jgi:hypothetical protein